MSFVLTPPLIPFYSIDTLDNKARVKTASFQNALTDTYTYNNAGSLQSITGGALDLHYSYDDLGNIHIN